jgi:hypothetical protein
MVCDWTFIFKHTLPASSFPINSEPIHYQFKHSTFFPTPIRTRPQMTTVPCNTLHYSWTAVQLRLIHIRTRLRVIRTGLDFASSTVLDLASTARLALPSDPYHAHYRWLIEPFACNWPSCRSNGSPLFVQAVRYYATSPLLPLLSPHQALCSLFVSLALLQPIHIIWHYAAFFLSWGTMQPLYLIIGIM